MKTIQKLVVIVLVLLFYFKEGRAQEFYVDAINGLDSNDGSPDNPFKSIPQSVKVANELTGSGDILIRVMPGYYVLEDKTSINPVRIFNDTSRFIIEAFYNPDEEGWSPQQMPVIQSISANNSTTFFNHAVGILVASEHVSLRGLKFLGNANPLVKYYYPITKEDKDLRDLEVSQCMFIGDKEASRIQGGVWAHGMNNEVKNCVFYECRNAILFFDNVAGFKISKSIIMESYESAFWFGPDDVDFEFSNNIVANNNNVIVGRSANLKYSSFFKESVIVNNNSIVGYWSGEKGEIVNIENPDIQFKNVIDKGFIEVYKNEEDNFKANHLHLIQNSLGSVYKAGLFKK
ncbi:hypothetical protein GCM10011506_38220 [Marivirga lumbricoides]|uniref:Right handed beta helix domain-containing protein n=1 Tax=Marivirga lumbricoides TaxID=1046115 RepID=A0ABQ1N185_9BACT|nr:hypothetical protein GCM10011506_38220 [Marivirga lumbricoides]